MEQKNDRGREKARTSSSMTNLSTLLQKRIPKYTRVTSNSSSPRSSPSPARKSKRSLSSETRRAVSSPKDNKIHKNKQILSKNDQKTTPLIQYTEFVHVDATQTGKHESVKNDPPA